MSSPVGYPQRNAYPMFSSTSQGDVPVGKNGANLIPVMANVIPSSGVLAFPVAGELLPAPAWASQGSGHMPLHLNFGCSIAQQQNPYLYTATGYSAPGEQAVGGRYKFNVANGAIFTVGDVIYFPFHSARLFRTTITAINGNELTVADRIPGLIRSSSTVTKASGNQIPTIKQPLSAIGAANARLGGPFEMCSPYGYGGAVYAAMIHDLDRELRWYRPNVVSLHLFENDMTSDAAGVGAVTLTQFKLWARESARMCLRYGAIPIQCSPMPYYNGTSGVPASRAADWDGLRDYLCKPVSADGKSQFELDVPGAIGCNLSDGWLDQTYINHASFPRRPIFAKLTGGALSGAEQALANWTGITAGAFAITADSVTRQITGLNFATATSVADIAARIKTALGSTGLCSFENGSFVIRFPSSIAYAVAPSSGTDISAQLKLTSGTAISVDQGWTDGVHPNTLRRFEVGQFAVPAMRRAMAMCGISQTQPWAERAITSYEFSTMQGTAGTATNLQPGSIVPTGVAITAYGAAVATTSRNADGSLKLTINWPTANQGADGVVVKYFYNWPGSTFGYKSRFRGASRFRINSKNGVAQAFPAAINIGAGISDQYYGEFGNDIANSMPADGSAMCLYTPEFWVGVGVTQTQISFEVRPVTGANGASVDIDLLSLLILPVTAEIPHDYV